MKIKTIIYWLIILITISASYINSLTGVFILDDLPNIIDNASIKINSFAEAFNILISQSTPCDNRQVAYFSLAVNYYLGEFSPRGYHLFNIFIHIINGILVFHLFNFYHKYSNSNRLCSFTILLMSLVWATNPIQTNAVTYIIQRMTSMSTMCMLSSLLCYLHLKKQNYQKTKVKNIILSFLSVLFFIIAIFCKEIAVILPLLIVIHELYFFTPITNLKPKFTKLIILGSSICITIGLIFIGLDLPQNILDGYNYRPFTLLERLLTQPRVIFHYIYLFLLPSSSNLSLFYDSYITSKSLFAPYTTVLSIFGITIWIYLIVKFFKNHKLLSFALLWTLISLVIESSIIPLEMVFEHRFYFPSIGLTLGIYYILTEILQKFELPKYLLILGLTGIVLVQMLSTITRNIDYQEKTSFYLDAVEKTPGSLRAQHNFAVYLLQTDRKELGKEHLDKAYTINPKDIPTLCNMCMYYLSLTTKDYNNNRNAEILLKKIEVLLVKNKYPTSNLESVYNLALYLYNAKNYKDSLQIMLLFSQRRSNEHVNTIISKCYFQLADYEKAEKYVELSLKKAPFNLDSLLLKTHILIKTARFSQAKIILENLPVIPENRNDLMEDSLRLKELVKI